MQGVILAAGRNRRLESRVLPFMKPLVEIDGAPLVASLANDLTELCSRVVIVVSPENAASIRDAIFGGQSPLLHHDRVRLVVQPWPSGPGDALRLGLELVTTRSALVCMGDNVIRREDIERVLRQENEYVIGVKTLDPDHPDVARLATVGPSGRFGDTEPWPDGDVRAWLGPLQVPQWLVHQVQPEVRRGGERMITTQLDRLNKRPTLVEVDAIDIGTPQALLEALGE